ncbi:MAG TPA: aspartate 1-decarboxylase [Gemmatimonadaceae bacterium]|nr:aspartate 1-decarboxylase [Gemmatimonadaceae bacterium]
MRRTMCKSKIHRGVLTGADVHYEGSVTIDRDLMDAADLIPFEKVQVVNVNNGARLETYVIEGEAGSGAIQLNGAAARLGVVGDHVIIISYADYDEGELEGFEPRIVFVDERNRIARPKIRRAP